MNKETRQIEDINELKIGGIYRIYRPNQILYTGTVSFDVVFELTEINETSYIGKELMCNYRELNNEKLSYLTLQAIFDIKNGNLYDLNKE